MNLFFNVNLLIFRRLSLSVAKKLVVRYVKSLFKVASNMVHPIGMKQLICSLKATLIIKMVTPRFFMKISVCIIDLQTTFQNYLHVCLVSRKVLSPKPSYSYFVLYNHVEKFPVSCYEVKEYTKSTSQYQQFHELYTQS